MSTQVNDSAQDPLRRRPPFPSDYCNGSNRQGPRKPPAPFLYQPFEGGLGEQTWAAQMDHDQPIYQQNGVIATLGESLRYDFSSSSLKGGTEAYAPLGGQIWFEPNKSYESIVRQGYRILAYQSPSFEAYLYYDGHDGHDFAVTGKALAAADGIVTFKGDYSNTLGRVVEIYHPQGYLTRYAHLASFESGVEVGSQVKAGQPIGTVGGSAVVAGKLTDNYWGTHLHFSVFRWVGNEWRITDPFGWEPWAGPDQQSHLGKQGEDPLVRCNGEVSFNLWVGGWPRPVTGKVATKPFYPTKDRYVGGWLEDATKSVNNTITAGQVSISNLALTASWRRITTSNSPPGRYTHGLAYDTHRDVIVLFGGDSPAYSHRADDTWEFNGTQWIQIVPMQSPPGRANIDQTLVYDPARKKVVLFGGLGASGYLNDTWEYDGVTWTQVAGRSPQRRDSHAMTFDTQRRVTVLFGGHSSSGNRLNDTWEYAGTWRRIRPLLSPPGRSHHAMAYDTRRNRVVLFGGLKSSNAVLGDTWEYDGTTWRAVTPTQSPTARFHHNMAYDSHRGVVVLFGGEDDRGLLTDTWEYDGVTWRQIRATQSPSQRKEMSLVYDQQRGKIIFFGGGYWKDGRLVTFDETWEYIVTSFN